MEKGDSLKITEALIMVSDQIRREELKRQIEKRAIEFLVEVHKGNYPQVLNLTEILESLVRLGGFITEIEPMNVSVLVEELERINSAIRQKLKLPDFRRVGLRELLGPYGDKGRDTPPKGEISADANKSHFKEENGSNPASRQDSVQEIRQSRIVETIRSSGKEKIMLKDIISALPEVSERTIRYDIQKLCDQGLVKRVGSSGPATHYVIK